MPVQKRTRTTQTTRAAELTILCAALSLVCEDTPTFAGPITGNYWYMGVGNDQAAEENETLLSILAERSPWDALPETRKRLLDNAGGAAILENLKYFHDNVKDGDTFVFYYGGHATNAIPDEDEDDPGEDEGVGLSQGDLASDDQLSSDPYFGSFPKSSTVIVIMKTCFAGGFIGGTQDINRPAISNKHNMLFVGAVSESACLDADTGRLFLPLVNRGLTEGDINGDNQVHWGEWASTLQALWTERTGNALTLSNNLDTEHDRTTGAPVPEPSSAVLLTIGSLMLLVRVRRPGIRH